MTMTSMVFHKEKRLFRPYKKITFQKFWEFYFKEVHFQFLSLLKTENLNKPFLKAKDWLVVKKCCPAMYSHVNVYFIFNRSQKKPQKNTNIKNLRRQSTQVSNALCDFLE
jgi:hypothetical protein